MRDCPTIEARGKETNQVHPYVLVNEVLNAKARLYALWTRGSKLDDDDDDVSKSLYLSSVMISFEAGGYGE